MTEPVVLYNGACPICSREIASYRTRAERTGVDIDFRDLNAADLSRWGLNRDEAARRMYVAEDGELKGGIDAFIAVWRRLPGLRWLARLVDRPVMRPLAHWAYERVAAPALYRLDQRRRAKIENGAGGDAATRRT